MNFRGIIGGLYVGYKHLDRYDIKLIKDNMYNLEDLLPVIDYLIGVAIDDAFNNGYKDGYDQAMLYVEDGE